MIENLFIGSTVIHLERIDSSNNYARQLVRDKMPIEGTVVVADEQTNGRGQRSNSWITQPKMNLTCSYILKPVFLAAKDQFLLSVAVSLALLDTVAELMQDDSNKIQVKWPNDLMFDGKKIAGILIENMLRGSNLDVSIVGIGLNVNQIDFPIGLNATSIRSANGQAHALDSVLRLLNGKLGKYYLQLRERRFEALLGQFNANLFCASERITLSIDNVQENVKVIKTLRTGELELERADGTRTLHMHHEIDWLLRS